MDKALFNFIETSTGVGSVVLNIQSVPQFSFRSNLEDHEKETGSITWLLLVNNDSTDLSRGFLKNGNVT